MVSKRTKGIHLCQTGASGLRHYLPTMLYWVISPDSLTTIHMRTHWSLATHMKVGRVNNPEVLNNSVRTIPHATSMYCRYFSIYVLLFIKGLIPIIPIIDHWLFLDSRLNWILDFRTKTPQTQVLWRFYYSLGLQQGACYPYELPQIIVWWYF